MAKEDGIYAMKFASQQMLIDKLQQENQQLKIEISAREEAYLKLQKENADLRYRLETLKKIKENREDICKQ